MRLGWILFTLIYAVAAVLVFLGLDNIPILDLPNHTVRQFIMSSLLSSEASPFADRYWVDWRPMPYLMGDLIAIAFMYFFSPHTVGIFMLILAFLAIPTGAVLYLRAIGRTWLGILLCLPFLFYLSWNRFFFLGYTHFLLSIGMSLALLAVAEKILRNLPKPPVIWLMLYGFGTIALYLTHSYGLAVFTIAVAIRMLWLPSKNRRSLAFACLLVLLPPLLVGIQKAANPASIETFWTYFAPRTELLNRFQEPFFRFDKPLDRVFALAHLIMLLVLGRAFRAQPFFSNEFRFHMTLFTCFMLLFLSLPVGFMKAWDVDTRVLLPAMVFLVFALTPAQCNHRAKFCGPALGVFLLTALLATVQLVFCQYKLLKTDSRLEGLIDILAKVPPAQKLLMVDADSYRYDPTPHQVSWYVLKHKGMIPSLFSAETDAPFSYFHVKEKLPTPSSKWYLEGKFHEILQILPAYDFIIANRPLVLPPELASRLRVVVENESGALYELLR